MKGPADLTDALLETSVIGSFTRIGYEARRRLYGWQSLAEVARDQHFAGSRVILTGATSGLGASATHTLARLGAELHIVGRDPQRTAAAVAEINQAVGGQPATAHIADLTDLCAVADLSKQLQSLGHIDVLIHNAGALVHSYETASGHEQTYTAQVLAPQLLTERLLPQLGPGGRVIVMSSGGMYTEPLRPTQMEYPAADFDGVKAYARAKRAQVELVAEWARVWRDRDIGFHAMHPGWADTPGVRTSLPGFYRVTRLVLRNSDEGADTLVWLAISPAAELGSGGFWLDRSQRSTRRLPVAKATAQARSELFELVQRQVRLAIADCSAS
jgi:dehydrogenase/reductase SDR family protein 12